VEKHDFFISYRNSSEGARAEHSSEPKLGFAQALYESVACQKKSNAQPVYVFWDQKCFHPNQKWEESIFGALPSSQIIVLLVSAKGLEGIKHKILAGEQDSTLVEYEIALLQHKLQGQIVLPIFLSEIGVANDYRKHFLPLDKERMQAFNLPDSAHVRQAEVQQKIDHLSHSLSTEDVSFLGSVSQTIAEIFELQGYPLPQRGEDGNELDDLVAHLMSSLERFRI